jgi:spore germination protein YaaH
MKESVRCLVLLPLLIALGAVPARTQILPRSIHQTESEQHAGTRIVEARTDAEPPVVIPLVKSARSVSKKVFGYHPYWASSSAYLSYDYTALSTIGYFSYEVDPASGAAVTTNGWSTTPIISYAHARGVRVVLVVTNFGSSANTQLLSDTVKQKTLIASLVSLLSARGGDGVNIDFEGVPVSQRANLVAFMRTLSLRVKAAIPDAEISMASPAVDWSNVWDFPSLSSICDYLVMMGYDYYYGGSSTAGPNSPLEGESYNVTRSVTTYLTAGVAPEKLLLGLPWYGFDWPVVSSARKAAATAKASSGTYAVLEPKSKLYGKQFDQTTKTPWFSYQSGAQWHQAWYDDSLSFALKYALVEAKHLAGIGIWALSYEGSRRELWQGMHASFAVTFASGGIASQPALWTLEQNFPNPFNPSTEIGFTIPEPAHVRIRISDLLGRTVAMLADERFEAGSHRVMWNASAHPSGVYFYTMEAGVFSQTKKLALVR